MTDTIETLRRLHAEATAGPWFPVAYDESHCLIDSDDDSWPVAQTVEHRNAALIVSMHAALPKLLEIAAACEDLVGYFTTDGKASNYTPRKPILTIRAALASLKEPAQ